MLIFHKLDTDRDRLVFQRIEKIFSEAEPERESTRLRLKGFHLR
jgi:hypothetical protein